LNKNGVWVSRNVKFIRFCLWLLSRIDLWVLQPS
jgi:hypothetical protein